MQDKQIVDCAHERYHDTTIDVVAFIWSSRVETIGIGKQRVGRL